MASNKDRSDAMDFSIRLGSNDEVWISTLNARATERIEPAKALVFRSGAAAASYIQRAESAGFTFAGKELLCGQNSEGKR
jgi:hypothetical protein